MSKNSLCRNIFVILVLVASFSLCVEGRKVHSQYIPHKGNAEDIVVVKSPLPHTYLKDHDLPENFDWSKPDLPKYKNKNCVTASYNQNQPMACGSCWVSFLFYFVFETFIILYQN